jgi:uncharacterized cupredoxin-like copper-binding protein
MGGRLYGSVSRGLHMISARAAGWTERETPALPRRCAATANEGHTASLTQHHAQEVEMRRFAPIRAVRLVLAGCLMALWGPPTASAEGPPEAIEVRVETGTADGQRKFIPDELNFERGKYYKLVIHNPSPHAHYFSSEGLGVRVFTGKIELPDRGGEMLAEVHGDVRAIELAPGSTVAWYFYPMSRGKDLRLYSEKEEDLEAGMAGTIQISGPPPFTGK